MHLGKVGDSKSYVSTRCGVNEMNSDQMDKRVVRRSTLLIPCVG